MLASALCSALSQSSDSSPNRSSPRSAMSFYLYDEKVLQTKKSHPALSCKGRFFLSIWFFIEWCAWECQRLLRIAFGSALFACGVSYVHSIIFHRILPIVFLLFLHPFLPRKDSLEAYCIRLLLRQESRDTNHHLPIP